MTRPTVQRGLIALTEVLALTVWFSVSAVVPSMQADLGLSSNATVWLTGTVQLGFVLGALAAAALNLADRVPPHLLLAGSAVLAACCTSTIALLGDRLALMFALRFLTGMFLAGVYPPGMKLMASWAPPTNRGLAMGLLIGALTLGSALPHLIAGVVFLPWRTVLHITAAVASSGALVAVLAIRSGPNLATGRAVLDPRYVVRMFREREPRHVNVGYFGHMWELYALWTWAPAFVVHSSASSQLDGRDQVVVFLTMGVLGLGGCLLGGWAADRFGRRAAAVTALGISGACCLLSPLAYVAPVPVLVAFCAVWGAAVVADSGVFSTALSEVADRQLVGTALSAQTAIGFALTVVSIQLVSVIGNATGWQYAFLILALGPLVGVPAMARFRPVPAAAPRPTGG